jgi:hypothetical protein
MTSLESVTLLLPGSAERVDSDDAGSDREHRWLTADGLYVGLTVVPPSKDPDVDPLALDWAVGLTLGRYVERFQATVEGPVACDVGGSIAARAARVSLISSIGEPTDVLLVAALAHDREVVTLQVSWSSTAAELHEQQAVSVARSLALPESV